MIVLILLIQVSLVYSISLDIRYPQFLHQSPNDSAVEIAEGKSPASFIAFITLMNTTDSVIDNWIVKTNSEDFQVISNGFSRSLITSQTLDRERQNFYEFIITARHRKSPYEQLSKLVRVRILDVNDCTPTFNQSVYQINFTSTNRQYQIKAQDDDQINSENSQITYSLANYQDLFRINYTTGMIESIANLKSNERYDIIVVARDHGKPSLSSTTLVQVQYIDPLPETRSAIIEESTWPFHERKFNKLWLLVGILVTFIFLFMSFVFVFCLLYYRSQRRKQDDQDDQDEKKSSSDCTDSCPPTNVYDAVNLFPNTYYLPLEDRQELIETLKRSNGNEILFHLCPASSSSSSPISAIDNRLKTGSDDGCYCSSDLSSNQSNQLVLLNPSSFHHQSNKRKTTITKARSDSLQPHQQYIDDVLKRFEHLYDPPTDSQESSASYV